MRSLERCSTIEDQSPSLPIGTRMHVHRSCAFTTYPPAARRIGLCVHNCRASSPIYQWDIGDLVTFEFLEPLDDFGGLDGTTVPVGTGSG